MNCYTNYIVIVTSLLCSCFNSTLMSGDVFMFARQQMKALPTHFLVSGCMFDIIYVRLCCNYWSQNNASDYCHSD